MIDLHCHILPGLDDGAPDLAVSYEMARLAAADGTIVLACTPHFMPGVYDASLEVVQQAVEDLADALAERGINLGLVVGGDVHAAPNLAARLNARKVPTINGSRYFLLEPPHDVLPPRFEELVFGLLSEGYVPILTHPERLKWIESRYGVIRHLAEAGVLMQLTSGAVFGRFGRRPQYWSERMLDEGIVHFLATDAHNADRRPPDLSRGRDAVAARFGDDFALDLVLHNPLIVLEDKDPSEIRAEPDPGAEEVRVEKSEGPLRLGRLWPFRASERSRC